MTADPRDAVTRDQVARDVQAYLDRCATDRDGPRLLSPKYHPTESSAVKGIFAPEQMVRAVYRQLTGGDQEREDRYGQ